MAQGMKIQRGREKEPWKMDTSVFPGRFPGPQQGRGRHWIGWIWDGADIWLTGLVKPRVIECMEWLQGDAGNEDQWSVGDDSHCRRKSQFTFVSAMVSTFVSPRNFIWCNSDSHGMASIDGAFVKWWSYKNGASSMRWVLLHIRDTQSSRALPPCEDTEEVCDQKGPCMTMLWKSICIVFKPVIFCYSKPEGLRQHPNNL